MKWYQKTSCVVVGTTEEDAVYGAVEDCPPSIRRKLERALDAPEARTILITNHNAFERMMKSVNELPADMRRLPAKVEEPATEPASLPPWYVIAGGLIATVGGLFALFLWAVQAN